MKISDIYKFDNKTKIKLPLYINKIKAGFPSPADDYIEKSLDLNSHLVKHPASTFFLRVEGDSMINAGIQSGDILIVDKAIDAKDNKIIIAVFNGELTVKRLKILQGKYYLVPENPNYSPIEITENTDFHVWGVVTNVIHSLE